ncbi:hypothetical protein P154DRAFT_535009 [Amniculicola lignicola CBS 123094]|uniref:Uncharacterized protein n=1 Tax=Amniculicola lignicola CBS 123094 TaxID=1392246 RepID=A0A6A5WEJ4_9PLEO|nr:hypothetical protein P154DRAFT_535009 [Amniculicola lignicola CBS 123094]
MSSRPHYCTHRAAFRNYLGAAAVPLTQFANLAPTLAMPPNPHNIGPKKRVGRPLPRIIPAVPLAFSRTPQSARPITPEETSTTIAAASQQEEQPSQGLEKEVQEQPTGSVQVPLTPDSKVSGVHGGDVGEPTPANSLVGTQDESGEASPEHQAIPTDDIASGDEASSLIAGHNAAAANGAHHPASDAPPQPAPPLSPAQVLQTETSTVELNEPPAQVPSINNGHHPPQPTLDGLVFGATQDSPAEPSAPQEIGPEHPVQEQSFPKHPPGFAHPQFAAPFYPGHSQHLSDPRTAWMYGGSSMPPPEAAFGSGRDYQAPLIQGQGQYQGSYQDQYSPMRAPTLMNGAVHSPRSHSQSPMRSQFGDTKLIAKFDEEYQNPNPHKPTSMPATTPTLEDSLELASYISQRFASPELADFLLQIRSENVLFFSMPVHGIIVGRSRAIASAIQRSTSTFRTNDSQLLDIVTNDPFVTPESLTEAIKILYGHPVVSLRSFLYGIAPFQSDGEQGASFGPARKRMEQAISYAAAGKLLHMHGMAARGIDIAKGLLRPDTLDQAFSFGLSGRGPQSRQQSPRRGHGLDSDGVHDDSLGSYENNLLHASIDFVTSIFPPDFVLHSLAPEMKDYARLPTVIESRQSTHNPRLSKIRFGENPPEEELKPDFITLALSSIFLSLPLPLLNIIFHHPAVLSRVGWNGIIKIMHEVVDEREKRRIRVLNQGQHGGSRALTENLYWIERVERSTQHPSVYELTEIRLAEHV